MKSIFVFLFIALLAADIPPGYYDDAEGLDGDSLRLALHNIIDDHNAQSYSSLHGHFESTDAKPAHENRPVPYLSYGRLCERHAIQLPLWRSHKSKLDIAEWEPTWHHGYLWIRRNGF